MMTADAVDEGQLRDLIPGVLAALVHRGADFATAEDAVQEALVRAVETWPNQRPDDPKGWLITTAWRRFVDLARSDIARRRRELLVSDEPPPGPTASVDETLQLYFLCAHPSLTPASAVALTLRAVGGLTTRQIAQAYLVPEADDGPADQPGQTHRERCPAGSSRRPAHRASSAVPGVQRGVQRRCRPRRGGDPASPAAGRDYSTTRRSRDSSPSSCSTMRDARPGHAPTAASCRCPIRTAACGGAT